jgi:transposase-like protein
LHPKSQQEKLEEEDMSTVETVFPHCKRANTVEKNSFGASTGMQDIRCAHCSNRWEENLSATGALAKSAGSNDLAELRNQNILRCVRSRSGDPPTQPAVEGCTNYVDFNYKLS